MQPVMQSALAIIEHPQSLRDDDSQSKNSSFGPQAVDLENI